MAEIKCPNCGKLIELGKSEYDSLLKDIENEEVEKRTKLIEDKLKAQYELSLANKQSKENEELNTLRTNIKVLEEKLISSKKDLENESNKIINHYEAELKMKEAEINKWKEYRFGDSTKDLGESLEKYCSDLFETNRAVAYPNAYFEKDNDVIEGSKGDFIFKDYSSDGIELVSIMFDMKTEKDTTETKRTNESHLKKLDSDRNKKNCEYAVLVSTLESDSALYNSGIVDVSHKYPKMFVVRPQFFLAIIGLIRNMSLNTYKYKKQVAVYQTQNMDITNFENAVKAVADKINNDYVLAGNLYDNVEKMCDDMIKKLETFKDNFRKAQNHIGAAQNQLENLSVRKLTKNNPTMKEKFDALNNKED